MPRQKSRKRNSEFVLIYGGTKEQINTQVVCDHDWYGPCIDDISRYNKCLKCFALERDMTQAEYYKAIGIIEELM